LVDLNRMNFHTTMSFKTRMKNLSRITPSEAWVRIISSEYAKLYDKNEEEVFRLMWKYNLKFQNKVNFKRNIKKKLGIK
ncbi:MAG: Kdo domain containing protein, partial [Flavobacterium sp.]